MNDKSIRGVLHLINRIMSLLETVLLCHWGFLGLSIVVIGFGVILRSIFNTHVDIVILSLGFAVSAGIFALLYQNIARNVLRHMLSRFGGIFKETTLTDRSERKWVKKNELKIHAFKSTRTLSVYHPNRRDAGMCLLVIFATTFATLEATGTIYKQVLRTESKNIYRNFFQDLNNNELYVNIVKQAFSNASVENRTSEVFYIPYNFTAYGDKSQSKFPIEAKVKLTYFFQEGGLKKNLPSNVQSCSKEAIDDKGLKFSSISGSLDDEAVVSDLAFLLGSLSYCAPIKNDGKPDGAKLSLLYAGFASSSNWSGCSDKESAELNSALASMRSQKFSELLRRAKNNVNFLENSENVSSSDWVAAAQAVTLVNLNDDPTPLDPRILFGNYSDGGSYSKNKIRVTGKPTPLSLKRAVVLQLNEVGSCTY